MFVVFPMFKLILLIFMVFRTAEAKASPLAALYLIFITSTLST